MTSKREHVDGKGEVEGGESINGNERDEGGISRRDTLEGGREGIDVVQCNLIGLNRPVAFGWIIQRVLNDYRRSSRFMRQPS